MKAKKVLIEHIQIVLYENHILFIFVVVWFQSWGGS